MALSKSQLVQAVLAIGTIIKLKNGCQPIRNSAQPKNPFFGLDRKMQMNRHAKNGTTLKDSLERDRVYGPTFAMDTFTNRTIITSDPYNIKTILSVRFHDFGLSDRQFALGPLLGHGIFTSDGDRWHKSRSLIRPNFIREQIADLEAFERHFQTMLSLIPRDESTVDLQDLFFCFTIDSATEFLFGHSVESLEGKRQGNEAGSAFAEAFNYAQEDGVRLFRLGYIARILKDCRAKFVDAAIQLRCAQDEEKASVDDRKYVFLKELAKQTTDRVVLRDELLNVLLAGRDTTASLLANMLFILARRPDVWAKLRAEVAGLGGEVPTYETLRNLKYVNARLYPVVPLNGRFAHNDTVLPRGGGLDGQSPIFVHKGTFVAYSVYAMHRRKEFYGEDANDFKPERWETLRMGWEYLPLNGGPRICVGQQYALTEASFVATRLVQEFERIESRDPGPWVENLTLTVCSRNGTKVGLYAA
ncbi:putative cytochrome P450 alkane hydroxylase [Pseudomassariella vexata]|uniref:Putative cytochrome P450 alkane hydroxylase n=1 Tax=Pseudomassariella vexata TaxID=1141098 RepID=A0A1Y2DVN1_9PEZI|nr:putative cytochrome P450 alkane hydroxylase [Pseudomassariella vexata]ORY63317.1 putative cytochrome P450 alkane hydroxylase [Pseudomassariella vexata]